MTTLQLYDSGEDQLATKLHVGCGGVYLKGYINSDAHGKLVTEVSDKELERNERSIRDYYQGLGYWFDLPMANQIIANLLCPMQELSDHFEECSVDKIVAIQTLEHLDPIDFINTLDSFHGMLKDFGVLIFSVPDMDESLEWLADPDKIDFTIRHLRGSRKDEWSVHKSWWTEESLRKTLDWVGFKNVRALLNFHCYPAIVIKVRKYAKR